MTEARWQLPPTPFHCLELVVLAVLPENNGVSGRGRKPGQRAGPQHSPEPWQEVKKDEGTALKKSSERDLP